VRYTYLYAQWEQLEEEPTKEREFFSFEEGILPPLPVVFSVLSPSRKKYIYTPLNIGCLLGKTPQFSSPLIQKA
jgi:hypothetical protein